MKIEDSAPQHHVVLTREYRGELVEVSGYIDDFATGKDHTDLYVIRPIPNSITISISNNGESSLKFDCFSTSDAISIRRIGIINSENSKDYWPLYDGDYVVEFE